MNQVLAKYGLFWSSKSLSLVHQPSSNLLWVSWLLYSHTVLLQFALCMPSTSPQLIQQVCLSVCLWQGYTQLTADGPGTSVNKTQMIESNCGSSGWSSCSANVFFLLSSLAYVSSPSLIQWWESMHSCPIGYDGNVLSFPTWRKGPFQEITDIVILTRNFS
jgi:hypothetical protein